MALSAGNVETVFEEKERIYLKKKEKSIKITILLIHTYSTKEGESAEGQKEHAYKTYVYGA